MSYNANIPQAPNILSDSQDDLLNNFIQLSAAWNINHVPYNSTTQGKHNLVTFPVQAALPIVGGTDLAMFAKIPAAPFPVTGNTEIWISNSLTETPITAKDVGDDGWSYLASGLLIKWGSATVNALNFTVTYPDDVGVAIPRFFSVFQVVVSSYGTAAVPITASLLPGSITATDFQVNTFNVVNGARTNGDITYFAIGFPETGI